MIVSLKALAEERVMVEGAGETGLVILGTFIGGLISVMTAALLKLRQQRNEVQLQIKQQDHKLKQEADATALDQFRKVNERLEAEIDRQNRMNEAKDQLVFEVVAAESRCRAMLSAFYEWMKGARRIIVSLKGEDPGLPPEPEPYNPQLEFLARQYAQESKTGAGIAGKIKEQIQAAEKKVTDSIHPPHGEPP